MTMQLYWWQCRTRPLNLRIARQRSLRLLQLAIIALSLVPAVARGVTVTAQVSNNNDDAEERVSNGNISRGSSDLELVFDGNNQQLVGVRFLNVNVPAGVLITNAYIQFTVDETDSGAANVVVRGEANANPARFGNDDGDISNRPLTSASVAWNNIPPWTTVGAQGAAQRTANLASIVTELIGDPAWSANNPMVFVFSAGAGCASSACQRTAESRNGSSANAPRLVIEYSNAPPNSADLRLTISDSPDPVDTGKLLQYTLTVTNNGPLPATGVGASGTLPAGTGFVSASASQGSCTQAAGNVNCVLGNLGVGAAATINIVVTAPGTPGTISFSATASATEPEPAPADNSATATTTVTALNEDQLCYLVADAGGGNGGDDLLTQIDTNDFDPLTNETDIGTGTGTSNIEAIAWDPIAGRLFGANANRLGLISTSTGVFSARPQTFGSGNGAAGNVTFSDVDGMAFDATSGVLYGANRRSGSPDLLFQIDMTTGARVANAFGAGVDYVEIGVISGNSLVDDIAIDPNTGVMYAAVNSGGSTDRLITINKSTGAATDVAQITVPDIEGLGVDANGNLWGTSGTQDILYEINKSSGLGFNGRPLDNGGDYEAVDCFATSPSIIADLAVTKVVDDPTPALGGAIRYSIGVTNNGSGNATVVQIRDILPTGIDFVLATATQGSYDAQSGVWFVGNLNNGSTATLLIDANVATDAPPGAINNTASVLSLSQSDPFAGNDSATVAVTPRRPDVQMQKRSQVLSDDVNGSVNPKAIPGAVVLYEVVVTNAGNAAADNDSVVITDPLPANAALIVTDFDGTTPGPVAFADGAPASGVTYTYTSLASTTDDIEFSTDGVDFSYTPVAGAAGTDPSVTHIRITPKGAFGATAGANFALRFKVMIL